MKHSKETNKHKNKMKGNDKNPKKKAAPARQTSSRENTRHLSTGRPKATKREDMVKKADKLIAKGKERGFVTYDEILKEFPTIEEDIVFLEELYEKFSTAGIDDLVSSRGS